MIIHILEDPRALAIAAASLAASTIHDAISARGVAHVMFASGNSQVAFLDELIGGHPVGWEQVIGFHMDEYVGVNADHPESFARYMRDRIVDRVHPRAFHLIDGSADSTAECARYAALLRGYPLDLCVLGIGENGHLAFNDPPTADFADPLDVKIVELDDACRNQQVGEGHFATLAEVPPRAITVTIPALLRARSVIVVAPETRKAVPVAAALEGPISTACPASILQSSPNATVLLEPASAAALRTSLG